MTRAPAQAARPLRPDRGAAMAAALLLVAVSAGLAAALADVARTAALLARNRLTTARALTMADGCLAAIVAELPAGWTFDALPDGPDGVAGTADDGTVAAPPGCSALVSPAPGPAAPARTLLTVEGVAGTGRRVLEAVVGRSGVPGPGALVWLDGGAVLGPLAGTLALDGTDVSDPTLPAPASLADPGDPAILDAWLVAQAVVTSATPPRFAPAPPLAELQARLAAAGALPPAATLVGAGVPVPALALAPADLVIATPLRGAGVLAVGGRLDIQAPFEFTGVVVASGGMRVASGATLAVDGAVWLGAATGGLPALDVAGTATVRADASALGVADGLLLLPRRAIVLGLRDTG